MRKLVPFTALIASILLFSMNDYEVCSGSSTAKAACSACHQGSISGDVFILDGKVPNGESVDIDGIEYEFIVRMPLGDYTDVQFNTYADFEIPVKVDVDMATNLLEIKNSALFAVSSLSGKNSEFGETEDLRMKFTLAEELTESKKIVLQGVLADGDGTVDGDVAFYKELTLEPKESSITSNNLTIAQDGIRYYPSHDVLEAVSLENAQQLRIVDMQGKVVAQELVENVSSVDLSILEKGYYIAVLGSAGNSMTTYKFKR